MTRGLVGGCLVLGVAVAGCRSATPADCRPAESARVAAAAGVPAPGAPPAPVLRELKAVLYRSGMVLLQLERYDESYRSFTELVKLDPRYQDAATLQAQARERLVHRHYQEGLRLYREERLEEAIAEWRVALRHDPRHADARKGIEQAESLLRRLKDKSR
jgi:tetratricopeptide (TPR) repeat protein